MDEEGYKRFTKHLRENKPQLSNRDLITNHVMVKVQKQKNLGNNMRFYRAAVSILIVLSLGGYLWTQVYTWEKRLLTEQRIKPANISKTSDWQCRVSINEMLSTLIKTKAFVYDKEGVYVDKTTVGKLEDDAPELLELVDGLIVYLQDNFPKDYRAYEAGERLRLNAWQMRKGYDLCEWIANQ